MSEQQWPTDLEFRKFAARVADGVMAATEQGYRIGVAGSFSEKVCCPMGACVYIEIGSTGFPNAYFASRRTGLNFDDCGDFMAGFDNRYPLRRGPHYRLGREYRRRALGEAKWGER